MSVQNFITDFYINKTGEVPSETMVNEIVGKYGDNYDELISDMSMQVGGEQFNSDHINRIKTQYKMMSVNEDVKKKSSPSTSLGEDMESITEVETEVVSSDASGTETDPPKKAYKRTGEIYVSESTGETSKNPYYEGQKPSSHLMRAEQLEDGSWVGFPSLMQDDNDNWINMSYLPDEDWEKVYAKAKELGEVVEFGKDKQAALDYGEGSWKENYNKGLYEGEDEEVKVDEVEVTSIEDPKLSYANNIISKYKQAELPLNEDGSVSDYSYIEDEELIKSPNEVYYNYGPDQINQLLVGFSEDGFYGDSNKTLKDFYEENPITNYTSQQYGNIYDYMKNRYPSFNSIADSDESYKNANYGIKDWDNISLRDANHLRNIMNGDAANLSMRSTNVADTDNAFFRAGLYRMKSNITYEIGKIQDNTDDLLFDNTTMQPIPLDQLGNKEREQVMKNQAKQLELTNDYNIVNQEWQSFQDPNRQIYNPFTNQLIGANDPNVEYFTYINDVKDQKAQELAIDKNQKDLLKARDVTFYQLMNLAKKIKDNYQYGQEVTHNGETYEPGDVIDRTNLQVIAEGLGNIFGTGNEDEEIQFTPLAIVSGQPTEDLISFFPDRDATVLSSGLPIISSNTPIAQEYNRAVYELDVVNRALTLNEDPSKLADDEVKVTNFLTGSGVVKKDGLGYSSGDDDLSLGIQGMAALDELMPETARFFNRFDEGFLNVLYGDSQGEYVFGSTYNQPSYLSTALDKIGLVGPYIDDLRKRSQTDDIDFYGNLGGTVTGIVLEFRAGSGVLKAPGAIAELGISYNLGRGVQSGNVLTNVAKYGNIDNYFNSAITLANSTISSPFMAGGARVMINGLRGGTEFLGTGLVLDKTEDYKFSHGLAFGSGFALTQEVGAALKNSPLIKKIGDKVDDFRYGTEPPRSEMVFGEGMVGSKVSGTGQRIKQGVVGTGEFVLNVASGAATGTAVTEAIDYAGEIYDEFISDPLIEADISKLPEEVQDNAKAMTTFYTFCGIGMLNKGYAVKLMNELKGIKPLEVDFRQFFRNQEAYNQYKQYEGTGQGLMLLSEGAKDVRANGSKQQKDGLSQQETIIGYNNQVTQVKSEIQKHDEAVENANNSIKVVNSLNNNPSVTTGPSAPSGPSSVNDASGNGQIDVPNNNTEEGKLENIENIISTPSDDITQATSAAYTNGEITKENGVKVTNEVQDVLATNSKIKGIQNTTQRAKGVQALQTKKELERELETLKKDKEEGIVVNFEQEKANIEAKINDQNEKIKELENYTESESDYVADLIKNKDRRNHEINGPGSIKFKENYPNLHSYITEAVNAGYNPLEALKSYQKYASTEKPAVESKEEVVQEVVQETTTQEPTEQEPTAQETPTQEPTAQEPTAQEITVQEAKQEGDAEVFTLTDGSTVSISEIKQQKDGDDKINHIYRKVVVKDKEGNIVSETTNISAKDPRYEELSTTEIVNNIIKDKQDAIQEPSTESVPVQESPGDSEAVVESVPEPEVAPQEIEVQEEVKVEDTPQEEIIEAEVEAKPVADKEPRTPSEPEKGRVRLTKIDKDLDALIEEGVKAEGGLRVKLSEKGYRPDQIDRAIRRKDSDALAELRNLKADLERQGQANKKYTVKSTEEFKKQLNDIINKIAGDRNIKFTKGELKGILNAAIGKDMQGLKVEKAIENAIVQVEKATKRKVTENIGELIKMSNVEGKQGKRMVGKISPEARLFFDQLRKQVKEADLKKMTLSELESIEEELSSIIYEGKLAIAPAQRIIRNNRANQKGAVNESLYRKQKPTTGFKTVKQVEDYLKESANNFVIVNGHQIGSSGKLNQFMSDNPFMDVTSAKGYVATTPSEVEKRGKNIPIYSTVRNRAFRDAKTYDPLTTKLRSRGGPEVNKKVNQLSQEVFDAEYDYIVGAAQGQKEITSLYKDMPKEGGGVFKTKKSLNRYLDKKAPEGISSGIAPITNDQAVAYYLIGKRDGSQRLLDSKINPIKLQQYVEGNPTLKAWADRSADFFGTWAWDRYHEFYELATNKPMPKVNREAGEVYVPITAEAPETPLDPFGPDGDGANYSGLNVLSPRMLEKTSTTGAVKTKGVRDMMSKYVSSMERSMAFYQPANTYNNLFNRQARPQMINLLGKGGTSDLDNIMRMYDEAITGVEKNPVGQTNIINRIGRLGVINKLAGSTKLIKGQATSGVIYTYEALLDPNYNITPSDLARSSAKLMFESVPLAANTAAEKLGFKEPKNAEDMSNTSYFLSEWITHPMFRSRWRKTDIDPLLQQKDTYAAKDLWQKTTDVLLAGVKTGDMTALFMGMPPTFAHYEKLIEGGMSKEKAFERSMKDYYALTQKTQQSGSRLMRPGYFESYGGMGRAIFPFTTSVNAFFNKFAGAAQNIGYNPSGKKFSEKTNKERLKDYLDIAFYLSGPAALFTAATGANDERKEEIDRQAEYLIDKRTGGGLFDKDRADRMRMISFAEDVAQGDLQGAGPLGIGLNYIANSYRGKPESWSKIPIHQFGEEISRTGKTLVSLIGDRDIDDLSDEEVKQILITTFGKAYKQFDNFRNYLKEDVTLGDLFMERGPDYGETFKQLERMDDDQILRFFMGEAQDSPEPATLDGDEKTEYQQGTPSMYEEKSIYE